MSLWLWWAIGVLIWNFLPMLNPKKYIIISFVSKKTIKIDSRIILWSILFRLAYTPSQDPFLVLLPNFCDSSYTSLLKMLSPTTKSKYYPMVLMQITKSMSLAFNINKLFIGTTKYWIIFCKYDHEERY